MSDQLKPRQAAFVRFYLENPNGRRAAISAGYSEGAATQQATRLLSYAHVKSAIQAGKTDLAAKSEVTKEWLVRRLVGTFESAHKADTNPQAVARLGELLARMHGYIDDKPAPAQQLVNLIIQR
jgi:phage terminase small subunit